jgi:hypothetical protein
LNETATELQTITDPIARPMPHSASLGNRATGYALSTAV